MSDEDMIHRLGLASKAYERLQAKQVQVPADAIRLRAGLDQRTPRS
jgi:hypothetical protein